MVPDISKSKLIKQEGKVYLCDNHKSNLKFLKETNSIKTCDNIGCEETTSNVYSMNFPLQKYFNENYLFKKDGKLFATYKFLARYEDELENFPDNYVIQDFMHVGCKIGIEVEIDLDDLSEDNDLINGLLRWEISSCPDVSFDINEIIVLANTFSGNGMQGFKISKTNFTVTIDD